MYKHNNGKKKHLNRKLLDCGNKKTTNHLLLLLLLYCSYYYLTYLMVAVAGISY